MSDHEGTEGSRVEESCRAHSSRQERLAGRHYVDECECEKEKRGEKVKSVGRVGRGVRDKNRTEEKWGKSAGVRLASCRDVRLHVTSMDTLAIYFLAKSW